jgi:hypothetical protein
MEAGLMRTRLHPHCTNLQGIYKLFSRAQESQSWGLQEYHR